MSKMHCDISRSSVGSRERKAVMQRISKREADERSCGSPSSRYVHPTGLWWVAVFHCHASSLHPERRGANGAICQCTANRGASTQPCWRSTSRFIVLWQTLALFHSGGKCCFLFTWPSAFFSAEVVMKLPLCYVWSMTKIICYFKGKKKNNKTSICN